VSWTHRVKIACLAITVVIVVAVLVEWAVDNKRSDVLVAGMTAMNPLTAVCFLLTATALARSPLQATGMRRAWTLGVALFVGGCGVLVLGAAIFGWDVRFDQLLFSTQLDLGGAQPNRMAPNTAFNFAALGLALSSLVAGRVRWAQGALILVMITAGVALLGYAYSTTALIRVATFIPMALHTAILFVLVCIATSCAMPEVGIIGMLNRRGAGSRVIRLMLPLFILGAPLLGWLRLEGELAGLYSPALGVAMLIVAMVVLGIFSSWKLGLAMDGAEAERVSAEAQRLAMEVELRQAQKLEAVGRLAAGIAHEINTPVQYITDSCVFLSEGIESLEAGLVDYRALVEDLALKRIDLEAAAARIETLETAHDLAFMREQLSEAAALSLEGLARVTKIVRATKEFAATHSGEKSPANLNAALESTLVICRHELDGVAEVVTELGDIPLVSCVGGELNQVFLNLIINAADAISENHQPGTISIKTWALDDGWVKISISDTGAGIPKANLDKIFEPFFTTKPVGKGTGQGLAIARSIVVGRHGGQLEVSSQPGQGATFTIALPA
jgi:signal transduction histidine kinase